MIKCLKVESNKKKEKKKVLGAFGGPSVLDNKIQVPLGKRKEQGGGVRGRKGGDTYQRTFCACTKMSQ
jgi:hypothetical protein